MDLPAEPAERGARAATTQTATPGSHRRLGLVMLLGGIFLAFGGLTLPWLTWTCVANSHGASGSMGVGPLMDGGVFTFTWSWPFWLLLAAIAPSCSAGAPRRAPTQRRPGPRAGGAAAVRGGERLLEHGTARRVCLRAPQQSGPPAGAVPWVRRQPAWRPARRRRRLAPLSPRAIRNVPRAHRHPSRVLRREPSPGRGRARPSRAWACGSSSACPCRPSAGRVRACGF